MKRRITQVISTLAHNFYLAGFFSVTIYQGVFKSICGPGLNCYACPAAGVSCPIGSLEHFGVVRQFPFFLIGFLGLLGMGVARFSCGWLCPFGFFQDMMKKLSKRVVPLPHKLTYLKYAFLIIPTILLPIFLGDMWFSKFCPAGALEGALPWVSMDTSKSELLRGLDVGSLVGTVFWIKMVIFAGFLVAMVFIKRPFCRLMCPLGAIFSLFNRISIIRLRVDKDVCRKCGFCKDICPMDLHAYEEVDSLNCIKCFQCTKCPAGAVKVKAVLGR
jgi:ferredoxin-type protein NapH